MSVLLTGNIWSVSTRVMCGDDYAIISWREVMVERSAVRRQEINILMYKYLIQITVANIVELHLNAANNFKMCYVAVIMLRWLLLVLPTKYNQHIMVEIYLCLFRVLHGNISVHYHRNK